MMLTETLADTRPDLWLKGMHSSMDLTMMIHFAQTTGDHCIYIALEGEIFIIAVYVDAILLAGKSGKRIT